MDAENIVDNELSEISEKTANNSSVSEPILTQEELNSFLKTENKSLKKAQKPIVPYNFSCPTKVSKEQLHSLFLLHDSLAKNLTASLPLSLRLQTSVTLASLEQETYIEYLKLLKEPAVAFTLSIAPLPGLAVLEISPNIAFSIIDQQLGGKGKPLEENRALTEIEKRILESFIKLLTSSLRTTWQQFVDIRFQVVGCETSPMFLQIVAPNEVVLSAIYNIEIADVKGTLTFCLPVVNLESVMSKFNQISYSQVKAIPPVETRAILDHLSKIAFPITVQLHGSKAKMSELIELAPGDFVRLDVPAKKNVCLLISGVNKFLGELVSHNKQVAFSVTSAIESI